MSDMDLSWSVGHRSFKVSFEWVTRETKNLHSEVRFECALTQGIRNARKVVAEVRRTPFFAE